MKAASKPIRQPGLTQSSGARWVALHALMKVEQTRAFADEALDRCLSLTRLEARDRSLALELVYGVLRHRSTLDWRLDHVADRPVERLPALVKTALRLGAYQVLYLQRVPASAAVNESVALVKDAGGEARGPAWSGFVNAVLRALVREPAPAWPDPGGDPAHALSVRYSCPIWLAARWVERFGCADAETLCAATLAIPPLTIRANTLRLTRETLERELLRAGQVVRPTRISPVGLILEKCGPVTDLPQFREGAFYVEDEAGQLIPPLLAPKPDERVLDACAAPGGKATHLAALMENRGEIVAMDRSPRRLHLVEANCRRLGVRIVTTVEADATEPLEAGSPRLARVLGQPFDRILVDAPCSGLGVLRRHPEAKWQKGAEALARHHRTQVALLEQVSRLLRPGGILVYSTCSTEPEENEYVINVFCQRHPEFHHESVWPWLLPAGRLLLNSQGDLSTMFNTWSMDAFFAARLRKADPS